MAFTKKGMKIMDYQKYYEIRKEINSSYEEECISRGFAALIATLEDTNELLKKIANALEGQEKK